MGVFDKLLRTRPGHEPGCWLRPLSFAATLLILLASPCVAVMPSAQTADWPLLFHPAPDSPSGQVWVARGRDYRARVVPGLVELEYASMKVRIRYEGANTAARIEPAGRSGARMNFLQGDRREHWRTGVEVYSGLRVVDLYPGIDLLLTSKEGKLKSEFVVAPGVSPDLIRLRYEGATRVAVEANGGLRVETAGGDWLEEAPLLYQPGGPRGGTRLVAGAFHLEPGSWVRFAIGEYDASRPLVIDPVLSFSTLLGGYGTTMATATAVDSNGNLYVAGYTDASDMPTVSPPLSRGGGVDAFVVKLAPGGTHVIYATYIGGRGDDRAFALSVDPDGGVYVAGWTTSADFPLANAYRNSISGYRDAFLVRLSPGGGNVVFSTYYGGGSVETANALRADSAGVWMAGDTQSSNLPVAAAHEPSYRGRQDGFLARFTSAGSLVSSTYVGGAGDETIRALAVDSAGNVYVGGGSDSTNLPVPGGAFRTTPVGGQDGFVLKYNPGASALLSGTYLGGTYGGPYSGLELIFSLAVDGSGNVVAGGMTPSPDFPVQSAWNPAFAGGQMGFVTKIAANFTNLIWSTYVGGQARDSVEAVAIDGDGRVYAAGRTSSPDLHLASPLQNVHRGAGDAFLLRLSADGTSMQFGTYLGGTGADGATGLAIGPAGQIVMAGTSGSLNFPLKGELYPVSGQNLRAFLLQIDTSNELPQVVSVTPANGSGSGQVFEFLFLDPDGGSDIANASILVNASLTGSSGCFVQAESGTNRIHLASDSGGSWTTAQTGSGTVLSNSQCDVRASGSSIQASGADLRIRLDIVFKTTFAGNKDIWSAAIDSQDQTTGWVKVGSYAVSGGVNYPPVASSVSPASGTGMRQTFTFVGSDPNGGADIATGAFVFNTVLSGTNACFLVFERGSGRIYLADNGGGSWSQLQAGSASTLQNSQCILRGEGSSVTWSGTNANFVLDLEFRSTWTGDKLVWAQIADSKGLVTNWTQLGTFRVASEAVSNQPPVTSSVSPANGSGLRQTFTFAGSDPNGGADIATGAFVFNTVLSGTNGCFIVMERGSGRIYLADNSGSNWSQMLAGSGSTLQNSQCILHGAGSSVSTSGTTASFALDIEFRSTWAGDRFIWAQITDSKGVATNWTRLGAFKVTTSASSNQPPQALGVSPASGSGSGAVFTSTYSDANGATDIGSAVMLFNGPYTGERGCFLVVERAAQMAYLASDTGGHWSGAQLGQATILQNSQCSVRLAGSSLSVSGNNLTIRLDIGFRAGFLGSKSIWTHATDSAGQSSPNYALVGKYNVTSAEAMMRPPRPVIPASADPWLRLRRRPEGVIPDPQTQEV